MKTAVLLRQQVPFDIERITFRTLDDVDDIWMMLFYKTCKKLKIEYVESWNWGGFRYNRLAKDFAEVWYPSFGKIKDAVTPDLIFARGGFKEYIPIMEKYPNALKIYYGAGYRYDPLLVPDNTNYDIVLVDTEGQLQTVGSRGRLLIKPACDTIFQPYPIKKEYDIVFIANAAQKKIKGMGWFYNWLANKPYRVLQIGNVDDDIGKLAASKRLNITFTDWIPRRDIPKWACRALLGICCSTNYESCPRVIPEYLAMNLPIVALDSIRISSVYINEYTGFQVGMGEFSNAIERVLRDPSVFRPYWYYHKHLSLDIASTHLAGVISETIQRKTKR